MAILKVARMGHPILRQVAEPIGEDQVSSNNVQQLIHNLVATMHEYDGAGLAAPQVHISQRVVVMEVTDNPRYPDAAEVPLTVMINPVITPLTEETIEIWEGCLSIPGIRGRVPRCSRIKVESLDRDGIVCSDEFEGFAAAVVQHECDHLDGILFVDRIKDTRSLAFLEEFQRYRM